MTCRCARTKSPPADAGIATAPFILPARRFPNPASDAPFPLRPVAALLLIAGVYLAMVWEAFPHPFMQEGAAFCCGAGDCKPYPRNAIERTADGWVIKSTGQLFRDGDKGLFPLVDIDGHAAGDEVWICFPPPAFQTARCLFILPEGS